MKLTAKATLQIQKQIHEVFEAIVNPEKMTKYFISESTGRMETGKELLWEFGDFPGKFPVKVTEVQPNKFIEFVWDEETVVRITLEEQPDKSTVVKVTEGEKQLNEKNIKWLTDNTFGWGNFLDCMKAYLEYGIQLRKGAFDYAL
ncbi:SRPBCC domain-containing protein [Sphingobacterium sp. DN00404]|uniref:SRPBCC domain-containing protein n=1 Tax=Sphingobacterium micropteri TaxID=2763501 RepID=A0ABR7YUQ1_9SPHI|nr:SRPBCC domain-containing protein [Sphingobacterium micropteri]MBD1434893.1 SRPBCC domain-containing protein [Sphingobacterium micropteri]